MSILRELCKQTGTKSKDWEELDGPETGVGVERWFRNKKTGEEAYCCDDQGDITISISSDDDQDDIEC